MLDYPMHAKMFEFTSALNNFYLQTPALWQIDDGWDGFEWIDADLRDMNTITYRRKSSDGASVSVIINFSPVTHERFRLKVPENGTYRRCFFIGRRMLRRQKFFGKTVIQSKTGTKTADIILTSDIPAYGGLIISDAKKKQGR